MPSGAPSWTQLRDKLVARLRPNLSVPGDLPLIAEILEREVGRRALVEQTIRLVDVDPVGGIRTLPKFPWRSIYTTNYDRLIEKSAEDAGVQHASIRSRFDLPELEHRASLPIFKIHGCISQDRVFGNPSSMIITRGDYRKVRSWKSDLLRRMQTDMESGRVLIMGQSLTDPHLDELIEDVLALQEEIGRRDRAAVLLHNAPKEVVDMFESRGLSVTEGDIDWFISELTKVDRSPGGKPAALIEIDEPLLTDTLSAITIDISHAVRIETPARKMFSGAPASYYDITHERTFLRDAVSEISSRLDRNSVAVVVGPAGFGKTTLARQVGLNCRDQGLHVWEHRTDLPLDINEWRIVNRRMEETNQDGLLILDNVTTYQRSVNELLRMLARSAEWRLKVLVTAEQHRWGRLIKHQKLLDPQPLQAQRLSKAEINGLVDLARRSEEIRQVIPDEYFSLSPKQQTTFLQRQCASDVFICLRNIFFSTGFDTIVLEEFATLEGDLQEVYKLVAALEAISGGSHRQLILRMLDLDYRQISEVLEDLSGLMGETYSNLADGIFIWRTRHPEIADIITRYKYADPDDHLALIKDLIANLRPTIDIEKNAIRGLCNSPLGLDFIRDDAARLEIIEQLVGMLPQDHVLRHRLVREFVRSNAFAEAEQVLEKAIKDVGMDPPLLRYRIDLHRLRATESSNLLPEDREALLRWAWSECKTALDYYSDNWYTYRSLTEVATDWYYMTGDYTWLDTAHVEIIAAQERLYEPELNEYSTRIERLKRDISK